MKKIFFEYKTIIKTVAKYIILLLLALAAVNLTLYCFPNISKDAMMLIFGAPFSLLVVSKEIGQKYYTLVSFFFLCTCIIMYIF